LALAWVLRDSRVTSTLIGASSVQQLEDNVAATQRLDFTDDELAEIDRYAVDSGVDQWAEVRVATNSFLLALGPALQLLSSSRVHMTKSVSYSLGRPDRPAQNLPTLAGVTPTRIR
jgi:hypothetical protein